MRFLNRPDVSAALWWFDQVFELAAVGFGVQWLMRWLPAAGSVGDQDAWLWEALSIVKAERSRVIVESRAERKLNDWRAGVIRRLRG